MEKVLYENSEIKSLLGESSLEDTCKLFNQATSVIFFLYNVRSGNFMFVSNSAQRILGYPSKNFLEEGLDFVASRIHPEDYPAALAISAKMNGKMIDKKKDFPKRLELRIKNNKGKWIWTEIDLAEPSVRVDTPGPEGMGRGGGHADDCVGPMRPCFGQGGVDVFGSAQRRGGLETEQPVGPVALGSLEPLQGVQDGIDSGRVMCPGKPLLS